MGLLRWIGSVLASAIILILVVVVGGILAFIGYFAGTIFIGACIVAGLACLIHELLFEHRKP